MEITHHAILYRADSVCSLELPEESENTEVDNFFTEKFGVKDARELVRKASNRPYETTRQLLVIRTNFITLEAQNALLKVLEEPPSSTLFAFVLPYDFVVIPTLDSRFCNQTIVVSDKKIPINETFQAFVEQGYKERLVSIEQAAKKKDVVWQREIKQGLTQYLKQQTSNSLHSLRELEFVVRLLLTRGASNKMLLEHAAMILPIR